MWQTIERFIPDLASSIRRFPLAVIAAVGLCLYLNIWQIGHGAPENRNIILAACAAFVAAGAGHLVAEGRGSRLPVWALVFGFCAAALVYFEPWFHSSSLFLFGGLLPLLMISPFLYHGANQGAVWLFNLRLGLAILLALVVALVFGLGLTAVFASLDFLFGANLGGDLYERVWILATTLVGPLYGLSLIPNNLKEEIDLSAHQGSLMERGVSVLVNYVMVPLAVVYALILHAYALKILAVGELPKGQIGTIVSLFALGGTATWLVGWPWRETGTKLLRVFMRSWFWLLPVPAILLSLAIWRRVSDYGVTPDRYGIALVAVWTALVFVYLVLRRNHADMRVILGSAAVLLLVGSFGPQGAYGTSGASQFARLKGFLEAKGVLRDGKLITALPVLSQDDRTMGYSMLAAVNEVGAGDRMKVWFAENEFAKIMQGSTNDRWVLTSNLAPLLGLDVNYQNPDEFNFSTQLGIDQTWAGKTRIVGPFGLYSYAKGRDITKSEITARFDDTAIQVNVAGQLTAITLAEFATRVKAAMQLDSTRENMLVLDIAPHISLLINQPSGTAGAQATLGNANFWVVQHE